MSSRRRFWVAGGVILVFMLLIFLGLRPIRHTSTIINDGKEPEIEGLSRVRFSGDGKLDSLLAAPQLAAAKQAMSTYIHSRFGSKIYTATIENTVLQNDGGIAMKVVAGGKHFDPVIYSNGTQFVFKVPAANYQTTTPQSIILNQYSGGY